MSILLLIAIFLPSAAALIIGRERSWARRTAIFAATFTLAAAALPAFHIAAATVSSSGLGADRPAELIAVDLPWYASTDGPLLRPALRAWPPSETVLGRSLAIQGTKNVRFQLGLDGLSVWPFILTCLATLAAVAIGPKKPEDNGAAHYRLLLILQTGLLGLFAAREALLFFAFYEFSLIPFFFMIAVGNTAGGRRAATRFLCIEAAGGQMVLLGLLGLLAGMAVGNKPCPWIFYAFAAGFAVRVVVPPFVCLSATSWRISSAAAFFLPAGLLAMSGIYGALLFARPMLPERVADAQPWLLSLAVAAIVCAVPAAAEKGADS